MKNNFFWPEINQLWDAKKACVQASSVAILVGIATGVITYLSVKGKTFFGISGISFIDSAIFLILGFFIYHCSRVASLAALVIYILGQAMMIPETHRFPVSAILFSFLFIGGVRGSFAYHEMKKGLSQEELEETLKAQQEETSPTPSLTKRIIAWTILICLAAGGFWLYKKYSVPPKSHVAIEDTTPVPVLKKTPTAPPNKNPLPEKVTVKETPLPAEPLPGEQVFKLRSGHTITGKIISDDPVYYTVETSGGKQEIVIKEDLDQSRP